MNRRFLGVLSATLVSAAVLAAEPSIAPVSQEALLERQQQADTAPYVLDVRTPDEYVAGHVPGALNIPHDQLAARLAEVPKDKDVVLYCRSGKRAGIAGQVLADNGYTRLQHLEGDIIAWQEKERPLEVPSDPAACAAALKEGKAKAEACAPR